MKRILKFLLMVFFFSFLVGVCSQSSAKELFEREFLFPKKNYYPETWFHFNGNNISKEGITLDLEAIESSGLQGIHLFSKNGRPYPGVKQIKVLSPEWKEMVRHTANECQRLGLKFTMQNCPGWSMTGGPWVPVEEAQRELVESVFHFSNTPHIDQILELDSLFHTADYNYQDVQVLAFPTPEGDRPAINVPLHITTNNTKVPWADLFDPSQSVDVTSRKVPLEIQEYKQHGIAKIADANTWVRVDFEDAIILRSITFSPFRDMVMDKQYPIMDVELKVEYLTNGQFSEVATLKMPDGSWCDRQHNLTLGVPETSASSFRFTFIGAHGLTPGIMHLSSAARLHNYQAKAGNALRSLEKDVKIHVSEGNIIDLESMIDLTAMMDENGLLTWDMPDGDWTVVRFGHVNMRRTNKPAMPESTGWECSKLDKKAIENHLRKGMIGQMINDGGPIGDGKLHGLLIDSWESFIPNWTMNTDDMFAEFEQRRGYSLKPFLPAMMGYIIDSPETTTKFLRDWRQTLDDVYIDNFFNHFAKVAHEMGAEVYTEGAGGEVLPIDPMRYYGVCDNPMTEFWYPSAPSGQNVYSKPIYNAASAMHLYNKPFLSAEACTQIGVQWNEHPFTVKYLIDDNFTKGVNHLVFHTFSHTPQKEVYPGSSFAGSIGFPFVRQQTWWKYMSDFTDYLARCQYMLQQGEYVADVLWYYGDHFERPPHDLDYFPRGYRFDYLNADILQTKLSVEKGTIHVKDAGDYRIIMLRDSEEMLLSTAQKLKDLVMQGAVILGDKPHDSPSLMDDEADVQALMDIADDLWGDAASGVRSIGRGRVYWGQSLDEVLAAEQISPDVKVPKDVPMSWIHRQTDDADIYFVSSTSKVPLDVSLSFRVQDACPQIWDPFTGEQLAAPVWLQKDKFTHVALSLPAIGSAIVVFQKEASRSHIYKVMKGEEVLLSAEEGWFRFHDAKATIPVSYTLDGLMFLEDGTYDLSHSDGTQSQLETNVVSSRYNDDWSLAFTPGWDAPEHYLLAHLKSLSTIEDDAIRHYSGTVSYRKEIRCAAKGEQYIIDLGDVKNIAELWCNGQKVGVRWAPPFRFDLTGFMRKGKNKLEVKVTNTWRNQLIYDQIRPNDEKKTWTTNPPKADETVLEASGLLGPVVLYSIK